MIDKKLENSLNLLIKVLKKEKLTSIKISNKSNTIEVSNQSSSANTFHVNENTKKNEIKEQPLDTALLETLNSPMVGIVYLYPKPGSSSFIKKGQKIKKGTTICLIEAMKTFNEIKAEKDGIVSNILVKNSEAVEFGQPLIELK
ncbi:MAG: acetyl-CoA carboxylase biotin carboxyl carrier protein subunit [Proteobacteria bacterium]|nr:acetyl-CoA carboxylase biotin carboxyl carrier protein subunit [Pseudomonadota bacterium]